MTAAALIFGVSAVFAADGVALPQMRLSLHDGVAMVMENNLDVVIERSSPEFARATARKESGIYNVEAYGEVRREDSKTPLSARSSTAAGGLSSAKSKNYSLSTGLKGKTSLGTSYGLEFKDDSSADTFNKFIEQYTSFYGVTLTQPLLKDFGSDANEQLIRIARKNVEISVNGFKQRAMEALAAYGSAYWELLKAREELNVRLSNLELASSLLGIARKKLSAGASSQLDVTRAESATATRRDTLLTAAKVMKEKERALKLLITRDVYAIKDTEIVPIEEAAIKPVAVDLDESIKVAVLARPDYLELKGEMENAGYKIRYAQNQTYPRVDIESSYGYSGLGASFRESVREADSNPQWMVGLVLRYPLGNDAAEGTLSAARIEASQQLFRLKKLEQGIVLEMDGAIKELKDAGERAANARTSVMLAGRTLKAEGEKYAAGFSTIYDVLKVQDDLAQARLGEIAAVVDYNKAVIQYNKARGTLLEDWDVALTGAEGARNP